MTEFFPLVWPELFGEVELDLAQTGLIPDLDRALADRTWHMVRSAILRLPDIKDTWVQKAVSDLVRRRSTDIQDPDRRGAGLPEGSRPG